MKQSSTSSSKTNHPSSAVRCHFFLNHNDVFNEDVCTNTDDTNENDHRISTSSLSSSSSSPSYVSITIQNYHRLSRSKILVLCMACFVCLTTFILPYIEKIENDKEEDIVIIIVNKQYHDNHQPTTIKPSITDDRNEKQDLSLSSNNTISAREEHGKKSEREINSTENSSIILLFPQVIRQMKEKLETEKKNFIRQLYIDYGTPYFDQMFREVVEDKENVMTSSTNDSSSYDNDRLRNPLRMIFQHKNSTSYQRLKQRVMKKIIHGALLEIRQQHKRTTIKNNVSTTEHDDDEEDKVSFVWVTSGNSIAAGHGNLYDETYTSIIEHSLRSMNMKSIFHIEFIVRNYALGATKSGPEIALCLQEIFGQDIDILFWHYAVTDNRDVNIMYLFLYRSGFIPSHPINILFDVSTSRHYGVIEALLQKNHLPILHMNSDVLKDVLQYVPDSFGLSEEQIQQLPRLIRNFRCQKQIEDGDPYCKQEKYNLTVCPTRLYQTNWHPGWYGTVFLFDKDGK
jgi:hypothetical protein